MSRISSEVSRGTERGKEWAKVMGMSIEEVQHLFEVDAYGALIKMVEGLEKVDASGGNVDKTLRDLGITEIRQLDVMKRLIGSSGELADAQRMASEEYANSNELMRESEERYKTFESQMQMLKNGIENIWSNMGGAIAKSSDGIINAITRIINKVERMTDTFFDAEGGLTDTGKTFANLVKVITPIVAVLGTVGAAFMLFGPAGLYVLAVVAGLGLIGTTFGLLAKELLQSPYGKAMDMIAEQTSGATREAAESFMELREQVNEDLESIQMNADGKTAEASARVVENFRQMSKELSILLDEDKAQMLAYLDKRISETEGKEKQAFEQQKQNIIAHYQDLNASIMAGVDEMAVNMGKILDENGKVNKEALKNVLRLANAYDEQFGTSLSSTYDKLGEMNKVLDESSAKHLDAKEKYKISQKGLDDLNRSVDELNKGYAEQKKQIEDKNLPMEQEEFLLADLDKQYQLNKSSILELAQALVDANDEKYKAKLETQGLVKEYQNAANNITKGFNPALADASKEHSNIQKQIRETGKALDEANKTWDEQVEKTLKFGEATKDMETHMKSFVDASKDEVDRFSNIIASDLGKGFKEVDLGGEARIKVNEFKKGLEDGTYDLEDFGLAAINKIRTGVGLKSLEPDGLKKVNEFVEGLKSNEFSVEDVAKGLGLSLKEGVKVDTGTVGELNSREFVEGLRKGEYGTVEVANVIANSLKETLQMPDISEIGKENMNSLANGLRHGLISTKEVTALFKDHIEKDAEVELGSQGKYTIGTLVQGLADGKIGVDDAMEGMKALIEGKTKIDLTSEARATMDGYVQTISEMTGQPVEAIEEMIEQMYQASGDVDFTTRGLEIPQEITDGVNEVAPQLYQTAEEMMQETINQLDDADGQAFESGAQVPEEMSEGMQSTLNQVLEQSEQLKGDVQETLGSTDDGGGGEKAGNSFWQGLLGLVTPAKASAAEISDGTEEILGDTSDAGGGEKAGSDFVQGIANSVTPAQELVSGAKGNVEETLGSTTDGEGGSRSMDMFARKLAAHSANAIVSVNGVVRKVQGVLGKTTDGGGGTNAMSKFTSGLTAGGNKGASIASNIVNRVRSTLSKATDGGGGKKAGNTFQKGLNGFVGRIKSTSTKIVNTVKNTLSKATDGKGGTKVGREFNQGINNFVGRARNTANRMASGAKSRIRANSNTYSLGANFGSGFVRGIRSYIGHAINAAASLARAALNAVRREQRSASPSKETMKLGGDFGDGFAIAIENSSKNVVKASRHLVNTAMHELEHGVSVPTVDAIYSSINGAKVSNDMRASLETATNLELKQVQPAHIKVSVGGQEFETFSRNIYKQNTKRLNLKESYRG